MPNAGKSTLITADLQRAPEDRRLSRSPRCTRTWAWCASGPEQSFVVADMPGLIEGASEGAGLGHQFLRHLQRTRLLLHVVDMAPFDDGVDPVAQAKAIVGELKKYDAALYDKPRWLVLNKLDMVPADERAARVKDFVKRLQVEGPGVRDLGADARRLRAAGPGDLPARAARSRSPSSRRPRSTRASPTRRPCRAPVERTCDRAHDDGRLAARSPRAARRAAHRRQGRLQPRHQRRPRPRRRAPSANWCRQLAALARRRARGRSWCPAAPSPKA